MVEQVGSFGGASDMTDTTAGSRNFDMGRVISETFGVIGRNFVPFILLALLLGGLPNLLVGLFQLRFATEQAMFQPRVIGGSLVGGLIMLAAAFVLQAAIVHATVSDLNGRRVVLGDSLRVGLRNCLPLIGLAILTGLGVAIGFVLVIIPGFILMVMWSVAVPAKVVEKVGVFHAFTRSRDLTRGRRWPIFGLFVIYAIGAWVLSAVILAAFAPFALAKGLPTAETMGSFTSSLSVMQLIADPLIATVTTLVSTAGLATLYSELRGSREGVGPEALASVFD
jgi:hypothetical protein